MSFIDCIQSAVESGRISEAKGGEGKAAYDEALADAIAEGLEPDAANLRAMQASVDSIAALKADKRWQRINEMKKAHRLFTEIGEGQNPAKALEDVMARIEIAYERISGQAMAGLDGFLLKYKPKAGGLIHPIDNLDNIVRAAYGDVRNAEAKEMAEALSDSIEWLRQRANMEGASIPENKNRRLFQTHDRMLVRGVTQEEWVTDHMDRLDWDIMRYEGKPIPVNSRAEILGKVYDGIVTNGHNRIKPGQGAGQPALAGRLARDRFLYYKGADEWLDMQKKYGSGNVYQQAIGMIDSMSRDIATMENLGPNPNTLAEFARNSARKRGGELDLEKRPKKSWESRVAKAIHNFDRQYDVFSYQVLAGEESIPVQAMATARTLTNAALLGSVFLSSQTDRAASRWARGYYNMPETKSILLPYMRHMLNGDVSAQQAIRAGVVYESGIAMALSRLRYIGALDGPQVARRMSDIVYRAQLAHLHFSSMRHVNAMELLGFWADNAGKTFDEHPQRTTFDRFGITAEDWDAFRATPLREQNGATFLQPLDMWETGDEAQRRIADKFQDLMQTFIRDAVPAPDLRVRVAMGEAISAQTLWGQVVRTGGSLLSFPMTILMNHWTKILMAPRLRDKLWMATKFATYMTVGGAFVTQLKAFSQGQELHNMDPAANPTFWARAFVNGGSAGLLGDMVFNNVAYSNSSAISFEGPLNDWITAAGKLSIGNAVETVKGEPDLNADKEAMDLLNKSVPKLWMVRLLMERYMTDSIMEESDPAAWRRRQKYLQEQNPSGMWWAPGEEAQAPNLETAIGG